jgi:hypothetical protein
LKDLEGLLFNSVDPHILVIAQTPLRGRVKQRYTDTTMATGTSVVRKKHLSTKTPLVGFVGRKIRDLIQECTAHLRQIESLSYCNVPNMVI